jgi:RNA polymerase sigma-70 factor (ECF subfamily)
MRIEDERSLCTSWTLVARLKNAGDQEAWREFYGLYSRLVLGVALKAGLQRQETEEVVKETMASVSSLIRDFEADPARGSFRAWSMQLARWRITDQFRKRLPRIVSRSMRSSGTAVTPTVERVPDGREVDLEGLCDAEWLERLREEAFRQLQFAVSAEHFQIFYLATVGKKPPG